MTPIVSGIMIAKVAIREAEKRRVVSMGILRWWWVGGVVVGDGSVEMYGGMD